MFEDRFDFTDLFVLDLANNHQGSLDHGLRVINEHSEVVNRHQARAAIKFQFRQLDSFIHPHHQQGSDHKYVKRFASTRIERRDFERLFKAVRENGLITMCTPFDEESVDVIEEMGFDVIKVASCSAKDWPLLEKVAEASLPVVFSTGGLRLNDIDKLVSFFSHRGVDFAIMHCVSIYPTPDELCQLNQIEQLRRRYPGRPIGWSTHEDPADTVPVQVAVAKGAMLFERHIGVPTDQITLNAYSSTPEQVDRWIAAHRKARTLCGDSVRPAPTREESESIHALSRGVYARRCIQAGSVVTADQVYFAIPYLEGQLSSGQFREGLVVTEAVSADGAILESRLESPENPDRLIVQSAVHEAKAMLNEAQIALSSEFRVEYSHHYGIRNFRETGAIIIDCVNRAYCKKLILQLPGQKHPLHFHKRKEETFQVLWGELHTEVDGRHRVLIPGDTLLIQAGVWHRFWTDTGAIFEEVSTTHYNDDSFYKDKHINRLRREERKTVVDHWGRFQLHSDAEFAKWNGFR